MRDSTKMKWFIFLLAAAAVTALKIHDKHPCDAKDCRAGRECVVVEGIAECLCVVSCPDHFKPVCGSDGISYDNHCKLHQRACISKQHISIKHKGYCKKSYDKLWKKDRKKSLLSKVDLQDELQNDLIKGLRKDEKKQPQYKKKGPAVCYGLQRNALRFLLVSHWQDDVKMQPWYSEGMTYRESLWGWFFMCDKDKDNFLTPKELLTCSKDVPFYARPGQDNHLTKALCIDALVDDGDENQDWRLDFTEFTKVMDPKYQPSDKKCSLGGKTYRDGGEVNVECNFCVCAVGNWVCASTDCDQTPAHKKDHKPRTHPRSFGQDVEIDNAIDENNDPVKDVPVVVDLWEEEIQKDKKKAKQKKEKKKDDDVFDVIDESDPFHDFDDDDEMTSTSKDNNNQKASNDDYDLKLEEYYDDILEKTKLKTPKKKKFQLEKALKEVRMLQKKTEALKELLVKQKITKENPPVEEKKTQTLRKEKNNYPKKTHQNEVGLKRKEEDPAFKRYYDDVFKKTNWNDLIDWGKLKNMKKYSKKRTFDNNP